MIDWLPPFAAVWVVIELARILFVDALDDWLDEIGRPRRGS